VPVTPTVGLFREIQIFMYALVEEKIMKEKGELLFSESRVNFMNNPSTWS
jgi:hypothetical protein